jgi:beta-lactamase class D
MKKTQNRKTDIRKIQLSTIFFLISILTINAQSEECTEKWRRIFEKKNVNGTIMLYDISSGKSKVDNAERCDSAYMPASTFKIWIFALNLDIKIKRILNRENK